MIMFQIRLCVMRYCTISNQRKQHQKEEANSHRSQHKEGEKMFKAVVVIGVVFLLWAMGSNSSSSN